jgi:(R)-2-hydroxyacyl-CoA dehydratese activating ATPase
MLTAGVDIGSRSIEVVLYDGAQVVETMTVHTGASPTANARAAFDRTLNALGAERADVAKVIATGYGRNYFPEADAVASEILCHARGIAYAFPTARTVIDIGGQDSKMIGLDGNGKVVDFAMNDRCAAGTGKFIEMVGLTLDVQLDRMGMLTDGPGETREISSMCAVFAESEIIGLTQGGTPVDVVLRGVFRSIARRTLAMAGKISLQREVVFTGGVARNAGVARALEREAGIRLLVPPDPQITGAIGAALIAAEKARR